MKRGDSLSLSGAVIFVILRSFLRKETKKKEGDDRKTFDDDIEFTVVLLLDVTVLVLLSGASQSEPAGLEKKEEDRWALLALPSNIPIE